MPKHRYWIAALAIALLVSCKSAPHQPNAQGQLVASQEVMEYFEEPEVKQLIAGQGNDIRCERHRRVGTHLIVRVCRTKAEWAELKRQTEQMARNRTPDPGRTAPVATPDR